MPQGWDYGVNHHEQSIEYIAEDQEIPAPKNDGHKSHEDHADSKRDRENVSPWFWSFYEADNEQGIMKNNDSAKQVKNPMHTGG